MKNVLANLLLTVLLVSPKEHVEPNEGWPTVEVSALGDQDLLHGLDVVNDDCPRCSHLDLKHVSVNLGQVGESFIRNLNFKRKIKNRSL